MAAEDDWDEIERENDIEALTDKLESLGIQKTCEVVRLLLRRTDLDIIALGRAILDVDPSWFGEEEGWGEKYA
jgi:hypothetical protein